MKIAVAVLAAVTLLAGCGHRLTEEQQQQLAALKTEYAAVEKEAADALAMYQKYEGGLLKVLSAARVEVTGTNKALLQQRIHAMESGAKIDYVVYATKDDPVRATQLLAEIENEKAKIAKAKDEAERSGGLVSAMAQVTVGTHQTTLAMLEQQYLIAKYGLAHPITSEAKSPPADAKKP